MWTTKVFKTREAMERWIKRNGHRYQYHEVFINNAYGLDVRKLRIVG
jgi:hypothetical protein